MRPAADVLAEIFPNGKVARPNPGPPSEPTRLAAIPAPKANVDLDASTPRDGAPLFDALPKGAIPAEPPSIEDVITSLRDEAECARERQPDSVTSVPVREARSATGVDAFGPTTELRSLAVLRPSFEKERRAAEEPEEIEEIEAIEDADEPAAVGDTERGAPLGETKENAAFVTSPMTITGTDVTTAYVTGRMSPMRDASDVTTAYQRPIRSRPIRGGTDVTTAYQRSIDAANDVEERLESGDHDLGSTQRDEDDADEKTSVRADAPNDEVFTPFETDRMQEPQFETQRSAPELGASLQEDEDEFDGLPFEGVPLDQLPFARPQEMYAAGHAQGPHPAPQESWVEAPWVFPSTVRPRRQRAIPLGPFSLTLSTIAMIITGALALSIVCIAIVVVRRAPAATDEPLDTPAALTPVTMPTDPLAPPPPPTVVPPPVVAPTVLPTPEPPAPVAETTAKPVSPTASATPGRTRAGGKGETKPEAPARPKPTKGSGGKTLEEILDELGEEQMRR